MPDVGEELIYRLRDYSLSEHVRVVEIDTRKKTPRYVVEFLDGDNAGAQENVPGGRLRGNWSDVAAYDELMANWERIDQVELTDSEQTAVGQVFDLLIPEEVAEYEWSPVRYATRVHQRNALQKLIGITVDDLLAQNEGFDLDGDVMLSADGTLAIAECACRINPMPVLDWVLEGEKDYREKSTNGRAAVSYDKHAYTTSPEWEYQWYLEHVRPVHELLRSWCGQRAATLQERLGAAEAENRRLNELISRIFEELKRLGYSQATDYLIRTYEEERITPANYRPVVDRPLKPSEIPVRYVTRPRRWGY
ncbi:hypothetical protein EG850_12760 [Gulosibacter macacae]|uniref:Uncharacterized protein n=1 Tax=Gulosibacter macacae TaxID=2488791 RepID=A0A3P3VS60_9MICO|nr:hypothetical protein [Gulosibacter macacae]RRJ85585.1 hypothetical protein EG850_12760 [Gulosibacter macacae]